MKIYGRLLDQPESEQSLEIEEDDFETAPDDFVQQFCNCSSCGLVYVEISKDRKTWELWRSEILSPSPLVMLLTSRTTVEEAHAEITKYTKGVS